jgi:sulfate adenylyltransferase subunit 2
VDERVNPIGAFSNLESESIEIFREVAATAARPVMLYSIGKDSSVMLRLAQKAFYPGPIPFPLLHIDTGWKFREMIAFRDRISKEIGLRLIAYTNPRGAAEGIGPFSHGSAYHTDVMKTEALKQALDLHGFDVAFGGARRDEEKSRAKERVFSFRNPHHQWDPKNQRPELWHLYNARVHRGEHVRVFPISNWTELDVWRYIQRENLALPSLYFAHRRPAVRRNGLVVAVTDVTPAKAGEKIEELTVRFRTVGDMTCTCPVESSATTMEQIVAETAQARVTERGATRMDDQTSDAAMERRKKEGYF